nr:MogA/MoaB family molybdenum cofactor biosynthesis protein [Planifilum fimeticola]
MMWRVGILTASTKGARGERKDESGAVIREMVARIDGQVVCHEVLPDDLDRIRETLVRFADVEKLDLVLTTGGTGVGPYDVTPEATRAVIQREIPGIAEAMRITTLEKTRFAMLSRSLAGTRGTTLIINLPGSPKGVRECLGAVIDVIPHALELMKELTGDHGEAR